MFSVAISIHGSVLPTLVCARSVRLADMFILSDEAARNAFAQLRWESKTHCGSFNTHRFVRLQKRRRCRDCYGAFPVPSGTVFEHHKLSLQKALAGIVLYVNSVMGISALQLSRDLCVQYKTAFVLLHELRETLWLTSGKDLLTGKGEIAGGCMHTHVRKTNKKKDRPDGTRKENQNPDKCVILVIRERSPVKRRGARRSRIFILALEDQKGIQAIVRANVHKDARIFTDEAPGYSTLSAGWDHQVANHSQEYQSDDGVNENQAESYISRFPRMIWGQIPKLHRCPLQSLRSQP